MIMSESIQTKQSDDNLIFPKNPVLGSFSPTGHSDWGQAGTHSRQRILVVDDDADIRQLHTDVLVYSGYEVDAVDNGIAAWNAVRLNHYDLLVVDNNMPGITGVELIKKLKETNMAIPVVLATGTVPDAQFGGLLEKTSVLIKPYPFETLITTVKNMLYTFRKDGENTAPPNWRGELVAH